MTGVEELLVDRFYERWRTELGYSMIALAQVVIMIAVWMAYRPETFADLPGGPPMAIAIGISSPGSSGSTRG